MPAIDSYLRKLDSVGGSDLHCSSLVPPKVRVHGRLSPLDEPPMEPDKLEPMIYEIMDEKRQDIYRRTNDCDFAYEIEGLARFRVNAFRTKDGPAIVFRYIPEKVLPLESLGVPEVILDYVHLSSGLVLVTGPTGSGKSTTLASLLDYVNANFKKHIVTIEEPIEFVHQNKKSFFTQREVGVDTDSFANALKAATREDPDIILVGELRDLETISLAITAAEMGFLVFATLHTNSAAKTIDRIIDVFPEEQQNQIRIMLSVTLKGVCAQLLCPKQGRQRPRYRERDSHGVIRPRKYHSRGERRKDHLDDRSRSRRWHAADGRLHHGEVQAGPHQRRDRVPPRAAEAALPAPAGEGVGLTGSC